MKTVDKVARLRELMAEQGLDAYVVPSADPHQSEYVSEHWRCRGWISGFSGSAGTVAFLADKAGLWTDGRYFIQAERELAGSGIDLFKMNVLEVPELIDWLCEQIPEGGALGVDGRLLTSEDAGKWLPKLAKKKIRFITDCDLIAPLWTDRPNIPLAAVRLHSPEYTGRTTSENLAEIRAAMKSKAADVYLMSSLYDIAWLCNVRGGDIPFCPVVMSYLLLTPDRAEWFVDPAKVSKSVKNELAASGIMIRPYDNMADALQSLPADCSVYLDERRVSIFLKKLLPEGCEIMNGKELTELPKSRKNPVQLKNWNQVHKRDGVAMVRFWRWLEERVGQGDLTECQAADQLEALRRENAACLDLSFSSISAYGSNAAMMHYFPVPEHCDTLKTRGLYLIDSGGQYLGGTTDITRTFALGALSDEERTDYTLVLKGMINLSSALFLEGATGANLDVLARQPLWAHGLDYKCGTGHGVGFYLNVHEGPQNLSQNMKSNTPLEPGMILTIEPGVYKENRHGIRLENMVVVEEAMKTESGTFLKFVPLTLCPIDSAPLKLELLSDADIAWLNDYHAIVYAKLALLLGTSEKQWLKQKTVPLVR